MIKLLKYLSLVLLLGMFSNCKKDFFDSIIEVDIPEHTPQLTVTAHFSDISEMFFVYVNHSRGILDNEPIFPVQDAVVELFENDNLQKTFELTISKTNTDLSWYFAEGLEFTPGNNYTLKVQSDQYGGLEGIQVLPTQVPIINATFEKDGTIDRYGDRGDEIIIEFDDPPGEKNYYEVYLTGTYNFEILEVGFTIDDYFIDISPADPIIEEAAGKLLISDASFDGKNYQLRLAAFVEETIMDTGLESKPIEKVDVHLQSVPKDFYLFWKSMEAFENSEDNVFAEPVNVYENLQGGIGIFTLSTVGIYEIELN